MVSVMGKAQYPARAPLGSCAQHSRTTPRLRCGWRRSICCCASSEGWPQPLGRSRITAFITADCGCRVTRFRGRRQSRYIGFRQRETDGRDPHPGRQARRLSRHHAQPAGAAQRLHRGHAQGAARGARGHRARAECRARSSPAPAAASAPGGISTTGSRRAGGRQSSRGCPLEAYYNPLVRKLRALPFPVIAAVNMVAAGAGCNIAAALHDIVLIAALGEFYFRFVCQGSGSSLFRPTWILPRLIGPTTRAWRALRHRRALPAEGRAWGIRSGRRSTTRH